MTRIILFVLIVLLTSCSLAKLKNKQSYTGSSIDVLRDKEAISATLDGDTLKVQVTAKDNSRCMGAFKYDTSYRSYLGFTEARNVYLGMFNKGLSKECKNAVGNEGGKKIALVASRTSGILGSSIWSTMMIKICSDAEGVCMAKNTFKVTKQ